ncbi:8578_t:CDS:2, partial [Acaulospora morrowiae]
MIPLRCFFFAGNTENSVVDFANLLENHDGYNVEIIVGEEPNVKAFKAHKFILTSRSTYFKSALSSRWARVENGITIFNKPNISPSIFEVLLKSIYTGAISVGNNSLVDIAIASDELQLLEVYQYLERCLLEDESVWNSRDVITILQHDNLVVLYNAAIKLAFKNPEAIFNSEYFIRMKETHLINLLKCNDLELDEIKLWEYLIRWGIENTNSIL